MMPARLKAALSTGAHALVVLLVVLLANHGVKVPASWVGAVQTIAVGTLVSGWAYASHWLATRPDKSRWAKIAHLTAKIMTLGLGAVVSAA